MQGWLLVTDMQNNTHTPPLLSLSPPPPLVGSWGFTLRFLEASSALRLQAPESDAYGFNAFSK